MFSNQQIDLNILPSIDVIEFKSVSRQYLNILILNRCAIFFLIIIGLFIAKQMVNTGLFQSLFWYLTSAVGLLAFITIAYTIFAFKTRKYAIREQDVIYTEGLLTNTIATVPISRIQHIEISRSWLARKFKLATLNIFTAGESGIDLNIEGLNLNEAEKINEFLSKKVNGTA